MGAPSAIHNAKQILVGATPANPQTTGTLNSAAFRANAGEIGIFNLDGTRITAAPVAGQKFLLALSRGTTEKLLVSDVIDGSQVSVASVRAYSAAAEQVDYIGYNGVSGAIDDTNFIGELYGVNLIVQEFLSGTDSEKIKKAYYQSTINDTQADIAIGIVDSLYKNMSREVKNSSGDPIIVGKAVVNTPLANDFVLENTGCDALVVKGASVLSFGFAATYFNGVSTPLAAGDYLRIGSATGTNAAVALVSDTYKIVSVQSTTLVTLDRPIASATGTYLDNGGAITVIPAAVGVAADWGVRVLGQPIDFEPVKKRYTKVRFVIVPSPSFGSTTVTNSVLASEGTGTYPAIANMEDFLNSFRGEQYRMGEPFLFNSAGQMLSTSAVAGGGYDCLTIIFNKNNVGFSTDTHIKELIVVCPATNPDYMDYTAGSVNLIVEGIVPANSIKGLAASPTTLTF